LEQLQNTPLVQLETYSGPLDLLLDLIRKQEMDIFEIDIYKITKSYVEYLDQVQQPDLEHAGDFVRMASLLLYIKSKSLIAPEEEEAGEGEASQLKQKLSQLLIEYQKFQKAGEWLYNRNLLGRDCWKSSKNLNLASPPGEEKIELDQGKAQWQLIQLYQNTLIDKKAKKSYKIKNPIPSLVHYLKQTTKIWKAGVRLKFNELILINKEKYSRLLSFLSLLELSKAGFVLLTQKQLFSNIEIFVKKTITETDLKKISPGENKPEQVQ